MSQLDCILNSIAHLVAVVNSTDICREHHYVLIEMIPILLHIVVIHVL
jgi:hypothetical protein